jgi:hypothetical protein
MHQPSLHQPAPVIATEPMQAVPQPRADTVVLSKLFNEFDLVVKYDDDMVTAAETGESSVALEISSKGERQVQSLLPSTTAILFAIGAGPEAVGVTHL